MRKNLPPGWRIFAIGSKVAPDITLFELAFFSVVKYTGPQLHPFPYGQCVGIGRCLIWATEDMKSSEHHLGSTPPIPLSKLIGASRKGEMNSNSHQGWKWIEGRRPLE
jgi:hypothetical protein